MDKNGNGIRVDQLLPVVVFEYISSRASKIDLSPYLNVSCSKVLQ